MLIFILGMKMLLHIGRRGCGLECSGDKMISERAIKGNNEASAAINIGACVPKGKSVNSIKGSAFFGHRRPGKRASPSAAGSRPRIGKFLSKIEDISYLPPWGRLVSRHLWSASSGCAGGFLHKVHTYTSRYRSGRLDFEFEGVRRWRPGPRLPHPLSLCKCVTRARGPD